MIIAIEHLESKFMIGQSVVEMPKQRVNSFHATFANISHI